MNFIASPKDALLVYATDAPSILEPSGGYHFMWTGQLRNVEGFRTKKFRLEIV